MDDDSDDSSSQVETLDQFREKWQKELSSTKRNQKQNVAPSAVVADSAGRKDVSMHTIAVKRRSTTSISFTFSHVSSRPGGITVYARRRVGKEGESI